MNPKTILSIIAAVGIAGSGVAVTLAKDQCRDVMWVGQVDGEWVKGESRVCEGDESPVPANAEIAWESAEVTSKLTKATKASLAPEEIVGGCACGPVAVNKANPCRVTTVDTEGKPVERDAFPGEHLEPKTFTGGCVPKVCRESVAARKYPGDTVPVACGGKPAPAKEVEAVK
jgi:hypothetical protein